MIQSLKKPYLLNPATAFRIVEVTPGDYEAWFEMDSEQPVSDVKYVGVRFKNPQDLFEMGDLFTEAAEDFAQILATGEMEVDPIGSDDTITVEDFNG